MKNNYKIKDLRKKHGDTLKTLANKINYDYSNLSKVERGIYEPSFDLLMKIANVYNVQMNYFFEDDYNDYTPEETNLLKPLDINSRDIKKNYELLLDGKKVSKKELEFAIDIIRKLRVTLDDFNSNT